MNLKFHDLASAVLHAYRLSIMKYDLHLNELQIVTERSDEHPDISNYSVDIKELVDLCINKNGPVLLSNTLNCIWAGIPVIKGKDKSVYILGPVLIAAPTKEQILKYIYIRKIHINNIDENIEEYRKIPVIPYMELRKHMLLLHLLLTGKEVSFSNFYVSENLPNLVLKQNEEEIYQVQARDFQVARKTERFILECVGKGDSERLKYLENIGMNSSIGNLGYEDLRQHKNAFIVIISLMTRTIIESGIPVEVAFPLSDMYILRLESMTDVTQIMTLVHNAILDFTQRVKENKYKLEYSTIINKCCGYINANINNPIKVTDVAKTVGRNPDALSRLFKKETGVSIPEYILEKKVDEAKFLLLHTDKSYVEISNILGFSSQSQFILSFKSLERKTPKEFRNEQTRF